MTVRRQRQTQKCPELPNLVMLWILRMLISLGGHKEFVRTHGFSNDAAAEAIGLGAWVDPEDIDYDPKVVRVLMRKLSSEAEKKHRTAVVPSGLARNIEQLARLVGLSETDCRILEFVVLIHNERLLDDMADTLGQLSTTRVFHVLAALLGLTESEVRDALGPHAILSRSGLVSIDRSGSAYLRGKLELLSATFADRILTADADPVTLLRDTVSVGVPAHLTIADYSHISRVLAILRPYLRHSRDSGRKGVNIFLHGQPGTGKSQLAKVLAQELGCELFEVASEDTDGDPVAGERRLRAFRAAQSFFAQRRAMILFDEVEDVFNDGNGIFGRKSTAQLRKAWINRALEENAVPTLWVANSLDGLDPAFIRRFDMVFELPVPPQSQRAHIIAQACSGLLDDERIARIAESAALAPAIVARAASVVRPVCDELGALEAAKAIELLIDNTLQAQGHASLRSGDANRLPEQYNPALTSADADLMQLADGLSHARSGRICLYGPPGTGKTAWARWLATALGMPLIVRRASDLMSKWVGESEKNIARAFLQAADEGAVLLIDEVDSFLQDRRGASHSWEVTQVNEMLTQMESFGGIFIASTNLMQDLDQAALRRFDLKVKFDFLESEQAQQLLQSYCAGLALPAAGPDDIIQVGLCRQLTPGDFAAVARQHRFRPFSSVKAFVHALRMECAVKEEIKATIGFL